MRLPPVNRPVVLPTEPADHAPALKRRQSVTPTVAWSQFSPARPHESNSRDAARTHTQLPVRATYLVPARAHTQSKQETPSGLHSRPTVKGTFHHGHRRTPRKLLFIYFWVLFDSKRFDSSAPEQRRGGKQSRCHLKLTGGSLGGVSADGCLPSLSADISIVLLHFDRHRFDCLTFPKKKKKKNPCRLQVKSMMKCDQK